jgi:hypothetical protein
MASPTPTAPAAVLAIKRNVGPSVGVRLREMPPDEQENGVAAGQLDLGFLRTLRAAAGLRAAACAG